MPNMGLTSLPVAATIDLQYRLPPPQQQLYSPTILISAILLVIAIIVMVYMYRRASVRAKNEKRDAALRMAEKILIKRGGSHEDVDRLHLIFTENPGIDPASMVMVRDRFHERLRPLLDRTFGQDFGDKMEKTFFPPPKDTRRALASQSKDVKALVEEQKAAAIGQTPAALLDLMDAVLKPGVLVRLAFEGVEGGCESLVMGHDMYSINVTLPANNDNLIAALTPGMPIEGTLESGASLMAFTSTVIQAVAGSMPYCKIGPWKTAWEIRKRDSLRLPISLEIDFQHISTSSAESIKMSNLDKEIGTIRPGKLMDISLGGCAIETPTSTGFTVGDMIRFSKSLVMGNPPATLLGAVVNIDKLDPEKHDGALQRLHVQFLIIDDVSQRILVRTIRQLQEVADRDEWMQSQQLLQKMRRNKVQNIGSPAGAGLGRRETTGVQPVVTAAGRAPSRAGEKTDVRPSTRSLKPVTPRPSTRSIPRTPQQPSSRMSGRTPPRPSMRPQHPLPPRKPKQ